MIGLKDNTQVVIFEFDNTMDIYKDEGKRYHSIGNFRTMFIQVNGEEKEVAYEGFPLGYCTTKGSHWTEMYMEEDGFNRDREMVRGKEAIAIGNVRDLLPMYPSYFIPFFIGQLEEKTKVNKELKAVWNIVYPEDKAPTKIRDVNEAVTQLTLDYLNGSNLKKLNSKKKRFFSALGELIECGGRLDIILKRNNVI